MTNADPRIVALVALAILAVIGIALAIMSARARSLAKKLALSEGRLFAAQETLKKYEPEVRAAAELRKAIAGIQGELDLTKTQHANLLADLQRYRALVDEEAELRRMRAEIVRSHQEAAAFVSQFDGTRRAAHEEIERLQARIAELRRQLGWFEREEFFEAFGLYAPRYDFENSETYKKKLEFVRERQRQMTKDEQAATCASGWTVDGSEKAGRKMTGDYLRLMLRAFNGECDAVTAKVTAENANALADRINRAYETLNKLAIVHQCSISILYLQLKLEELSLFHEYRLKKQEEREEQRAIQEQIRDEKRAAEEIERARKQADQDERKHQQALAKARAEVALATGAKQARLLQQIADLEAQLSEAQRRQRAISQAELTRAGHVYVISNIGSFGEQMFKIGMTRRLDPMDRVIELGDASVPFPFDVHAIISTSDAPKLENALHRMFHVRRVNSVNLRKEFFHVTLDEIETAVHGLHGSIEFTKLADAAEYRTSLANRDSPAAVEAVRRRVAARAQSESMASA